jgi:hypothetical protein
VAGVDESTMVMTPLSTVKVNFLGIFLMFHTVSRFDTCIHHFCCASMLKVLLYNHLCAYATKRLLQCDINGLVNFPELIFFLDAFFLLKTGT